MGTLQSRLKRHQLCLLLRELGSGSWAGRDGTPRQGPALELLSRSQGAHGVPPAPRGFPHHHKTLQPTPYQLHLSRFPLPPDAFPWEAEHGQSRGGEVPTALPITEVANPKQGTCAWCIAPGPSAASGDRDEAGVTRGKCQWLLPASSTCWNEVLGGAGAMLCAGLGTSPGEGKGTWQGPTGPAAPGREGEARGVCRCPPGAAHPPAHPWLEGLSFGDSPSRLFSPSSRSHAPGLLWEKGLKSGT